MKLPLDFGIKLFFRLLLPGFFLALGLLPAMLALLHSTGLIAQMEIAFVAAAILMGWLILAADEPIYRLLEGRRYWPSWLWRKLHNSEVDRLKELGKQIDAYFLNQHPSEEQKRQYLEASVERRSFPIGEDGQPYVEYPSRLGNLIHSFETYSDTRYGLDAIFYWPRIWVNLDKDTREELDSTQAMADSAVYCTFALACLGLMWMLYALLGLVNAPAGSLALKVGLLSALLPPGVFRYLPSVPTSLIIAATTLVLSRVVYHFAFFTNQKFGTVFMALVDTHVGKVGTYVDVAGITKKVARAAQIPTTGDGEFEITRRYLQYFQVKLPGRPRSGACQGV